MERIQLTEGLDISRIVYGMWRLGDDDNTSTPHIQAKIEACLEQGITTLDQADIYGEYTSESLLGAALRAAPDLRDKVEIVTKCDIVAPCGKYADKRVKYYDTSPAHIIASLNASLQHMATAYVDVLLLHRPDPLMNHFQTGAALDELIAAGKVRAVGVSNFKPHDWTLLQSAMTNRLVTNQIEISLLAPEALTNGDIAFLQERGAPPMAWSPLGGGGLFSSDNMALWNVLRGLSQEHNVDITAVAVAWLLQHPATIVPVMGTNSLNRIRSLSDALRIQMDRETWFELYSAALGAEVP